MLLATLLTFGLVGCKIEAPKNSSSTNVKPSLEPVSVEESSSIEDVTTVEDITTEDEESSLVEESSLEDESSPDEVSSLEDSTLDVGESLSEDVSEPDTTTEVEAPHDGLTEETAFTAAEAIDFVSQLENLKPTIDIYYVKGLVVSSTYKEKYNSYDITLEGEDGQVFLLYSVGLHENIKGDYTAENALVGYTVGCSGYLELYYEKFEMPYLSAKYSPTGAAFTPTVYLLGLPDDTPMGE